MKSSIARLLALCGFVAIVGCSTHGPALEDTGFVEASRYLEMDASQIGLAFDAALYPNNALATGWEAFTWSGADTYHRGVVSGKVITAEHKIGFLIWDHNADAFLSVYSEDISQLRRVIVRRIDIWGNNRLLYLHHPEYVHTLNISWETDGQELIAHLAAGGVEIIDES